MFLQRTLTTLPGAITPRHSPAPRLRARRVEKTAPAAATLPLTLEAIGRALTTNATTRSATVLSVSVDDQHGRTRLDLALAPDAIDAPALAAAAAEVFRQAFSTTFGALRIDVYGASAGNNVAGLLVATHADFLPGEARRAS